MQSGVYVAAVTSLVACVLFGSSSPATAQSPELELDSVLAKPPSPGAIALLVTHTSGPKALERLSTALEDPRPEVRAAAARVIYAAGVSSLREQLEIALAAETEPRVARELLRPVLVFGGRSGTERALEAASRLEMGSTVALALAAVQRERALAHFETLREAPAFPITTFLSIASRTAFDALGPLMARALRESDAAYWEAFLAISQIRRESVDPGALVFAVSASSVGLRVTSLAYLVQRVARGGGLPADVEDALRDRVQRRDVVDSIEERFLLELVARAWGETIRQDDEWVRRREAKERSYITTSVSRDLLLLLTDDERRALAEQTWDDEEAYDWIDDARNEPTTLAEATPSGRQRTRTEPVLATVGGYPPGFVEDLLDVSGCKPRSEDWVSAEIAYSMDGRPIDAKLPDREELSPECWSAARALLLTHVVPTIRLAHEAAWNQLVVSFHDDFFGCLADSSVHPGIHSAERNFTLPKQSSQPELDSKEWRDLVELGTRAWIAARAIVDSTGCVRNVQIADPLDNEIDRLVLNKITEWRYEPTARFEGQPISLEMFVTYTFYR